MNNYEKEFTFWAGLEKLLFWTAPPGIPQWPWWLGDSGGLKSNFCKFQRIPALLVGLLASRALCQLIFLHQELACPCTCWILRDGVISSYPESWQLVLRSHTQQCTQKASTWFTSHFFLFPNKAHCDQKHKQPGVSLLLPSSWQKATPVVISATNSCQVNDWEPQSAFWSMVYFCMPYLNLFRVKEIPLASSKHGWRHMNSKVEGHFRALFSCVFVEGVGQAPPSPVVSLIMETQLLICLLNW